MSATTGMERISLRPHPHLYEIHTWAWLERLSRQQGRKVRLGTVPEAEWEELERLGFDLIWLMGVWRRSPAARRMARTESQLFAAYEDALPGWTSRDVVGSPYAVYAYEPDPRMGSWTEIDQVRAQLHARGMGLILDFVPNHTAIDHPWVTTHPHYYLEGTRDDYRKNPAAFRRVRHGNGRRRYLARGRDPFFLPWSDTAQLNYFNPATRQAMLGELARIAEHCDGVRCDMAMLVLNEVFAKTWDRLVNSLPVPRREFWSEALAAHPGFLFLAEVYWNLEPRLQELGFPFTYDKSFTDYLRQGTPAEVRRHLERDWSYHHRSMRFLENHDEERSATVFGGDRLPAVATLIGTLPGLRFYHQGQLEGKKTRLPIQLAQAAEEPTDERVLRFYERLLRLTEEEVFHQGNWRLLAVHPTGEKSADNLIAYRWRSERARKLVVVNLDAATAQGRVDLAGELDSSAHYVFWDQLNDARYPRRGEELTHHGLFVRLEGHQAHLFDVSRAQRQ